ncbi:MAG: replicative DNA helicase [Lachnospiraceae bacterium]|jgi:replicative DNA helicase|nr:replicative DNA helicase [Lachnospiraceae bacterium]MCI1397359.1 replicative DNA helicase [Lachnospiraceae bacterium]MCI1422727.1 replicative DNA helicase [Lachnospiraceae bacterium]MCI1451637.1 replicative DNA helicase [Lachnospiraceae bacterium]MDD5849018.1 replicative DNA helicase [Bacillota bacterium]
MAEDNTITRVMPYSSDAEMSVIGAMLMDQQAIAKAQELLRPEDFYNRQYGVMFETIVELDSKGMAVDPVTLQNALREKNLPAETYSTEAIGGLIAQVPTSANVQSYCRIVAEKATLRSLIRTSEEVANDAYAEKEPAEKLVEKAENSMFRLSQRNHAGDFVPIREVVLNAVDRIVASSKTDGNVTGIATGFTDLDNKTAGLQNSDLVLIAARPSMGKTAFALNIADKVAVKDHKHVAIFSLEMSKEQLINRVFSLESHVDAQKLRTGTLTDGEWSDLIESANIIGGSGLILDDTPAITVPALRSKCLHYKMEMGLDLIIIDYLQLMTGSGGHSGDSRQQEVSEISRSLKALARELEVPVVALSQLSRAVESRVDKRPMLSDLRESGAIEQDADVVMFIYRDDYYHPDTPDKGISEIIIAKQRNGPIGTVQLKWLPELTKFANLAPAGAYGVPAGGGA